MHGHYGTARRRRKLGRVFAIPAALAMISTLGLVSALVGDGIFDAVSWVTLGIPVALILWAVYGRDLFHR